MSSIFDQGPPPPSPSSFNMAGYVLNCAPDLGDKCALSVVGNDTQQDWSYSQIETAVRGCATGLLQMGLKPGARILMRLGNTPEFPIMFLAAITAGLVPVPTSTQLTTPEVDKICNDLSPALIVATAGVDLPSTAPCPVLDAQALRDFYSLPAAQFDMGDPDRLAYIIYTSGTSGQSRAVCHGHRAIWARRMMLQGWYGMTAQDRILHAGAFNWTYTLGTGLMDPWTTGATALIPSPEVTPADLSALLAKHNASIFAAAPGVYRQMLKSDLTPMQDLRHGLSAGEKLPERVREHWQSATDTKIYEAFGMSECSTFISGSPSHPAPVGASGYPQTGRRVAILDDDATPVPHDTAGVLAIHRDDPGLMLGYLDAPKETASKIRGEWFLTGDTCQMAADGAITYLGRDDDMMNAGGFRVSPVEVETALATHPDIQEVAAVEVMVKADTTVIAAFYTAAKVLDEAELQAFAKTKMARYKTPRIFQHIEALPKGANGKLLRRAIRKSYEAKS